MTSYKSQRTVRDIPLRNNDGHDAEHRHIEWLRNTAKEKRRITIPWEVLLLSDLNCFVIAKANVGKKIPYFKILQPTKTHPKEWWNSGSLSCHIYVNQEILYQWTENSQLQIVHCYIFSIPILNHVFAGISVFQSLVWDVGCIVLVVFLSFHGLYQGVWENSLVVFSLLISTCKYGVRYMYQTNILVRTRNAYAINLAHSNSNRTEVQIKLSQECYNLLIIASRTPKFGSVCQKRIW